MEQEEYSLNDDRRVRTLSPGALTAKRFFRNRLAVAGLVILGAMFLFSFLGGALIPYGEDQVFYRQETQLKEYAGATENTRFRYIIAPGQSFGAVLQAKFELTRDTFTHQDVTYRAEQEAPGVYAIYEEDTLLAVASRDIFHSAGAVSFETLHQALKTYARGGSAFEAEGKQYILKEGAVYLDEEEVGYISAFVIQSPSGNTLSRPFQEAASYAIAQSLPEFTFDNKDYLLRYDPATQVWSVLEETTTRVYDAYASPSRQHPLGTDKNGMDMLTRLMYGGRVSLVIGFIVVLIAALLGVVVGGVSGYFGGWADTLIMRVVDIFYCIPSTPLLIILGAALDGMRVDPQLRMLYLMLVLGFLGWPSIARLVRGQILSLREQEFMTATESSGLSIRRRIFRHLIPNVIPQLIVTCTMSLGSTIITEATLSFLGLGVKFPFASWGNIMNDVSNAFVLTNYWFVWIPAGVCLMLAVLGFNFVGDGLRDAFDPKMKR